MIVNNRPAISEFQSKIGIFRLRIGQMNFNILGQHFHIIQKSGLADS